MTQTEKQEMLQRQQEIIINREAQLRQKDYIGTKIAMGVATVEDYREEIAQTEQWRREINEAEKEIERLEAMETEEDMQAGAEGMQAGEPPAAVG